MDNLKNLVWYMWSDDDGVLTFEWVLLVTLLTVGIMGGIAAARDAIIDELGDVAEASIGIDQSYSMAGFPTFGIPSSEYKDEKAHFMDCDRNTSRAGQLPSHDVDF